MLTEGADTALSKHAHHKCCPVINRARGGGRRELGEGSEGGVKAGKETRQSGKGTGRVKGEE